MCRAYVRVINVANMVEVSRRGRYALGFRSTYITMTNADTSRLVYGLAKASFNVPHGMFFQMHYTMMLDAWVFGLVSISVVFAG